MLGGKLSRRAFLQASGVADRELLRYFSSWGQLCALAGVSSAERVARHGATTDQIALSRSSSFRPRPSIRLVAASRGSADAPGHTYRWRRTTKAPGKRR